MGFEAHYPNSGAPAASFTPATNPIAAGSPESREKGIVSEITRGGRVYSYKAGARYALYLFSFRLDESEKDELDAFIEAAGGAAFDWREDTDCGSVTTTTSGYLAPGYHSLTYNRLGRGRYETTVGIIVNDL